MDTATPNVLVDLHVHELSESPDNPRQITPERYDALKYALEKDPEMMRARPIIADTHGNVIAGNMRLRAARELGWDTVPVYIFEGSDARRREWMVRDNTAYGDWVPDELAQLVASHEHDGGDLALLGPTRQELDDLRQLGDTPAGSGDDPGDPLPPTFAVVIECEDESQQAQLLEAVDGLDFGPFRDVRAILV